MLGFTLRYLFLIPALLYSVFASSRDYRKDIEDYLKGLSYLSAFFEQIDENVVYEGHIYIRKDGSQQRVRIDYRDDSMPLIFIDNETMTICDPITWQEKNRSSISYTPIYTILNNGIDLTKERYSIDSSQKDSVKITIYTIVPSGNMEITLTFSIYPNGNISNLEGWHIKEPSGKEFDVVLLTTHRYVNDPKKVPLEVFEKHTNN